MHKHMKHAYELAVIGGGPAGTSGASGFLKLLFRDSDIGCSECA
jgi:hypothetical protein